MSAVAARGVDPSLSLYRLLDPEVLANPYPLFHRLRTEDPVHWDPFLHAWVVTRYADVVTVLYKFSADRTPSPEQLAAMGLETLTPIARVMVKQMLFLPVWLNFTPELCEHNLKILRAIQKAALSLGPDEKVKLEALQHFLTAAQSASKPPGSDMNIQNSIGTLVDTRLSKAKRNARRQKRQKPSTPPPLAACR